MAEPYVPTTDEVRDLFSLDCEGCDDPELAAEFDAWMAAHDRQVVERAAARAWQEGYMAGCEDRSVVDEWRRGDRGFPTPSANPYRADSLAPRPAAPGVSVSAEAVRAAVCHVANVIAVNECRRFEVGHEHDADDCPTARAAIDTTLAALGVTVTDGGA